MSVFNDRKIVELNHKRVYCLNTQIFWTFLRSRLAESLNPSAQNDFRSCPCRKAPNSGSMRPLKTEAL